MTQRGFTLVEMVVAIVVSAIVVGFMSMFLVSPVNAYLAQERRTDLTDSASSAIRLLENDVHNALPASVRFSNVGNSRAMEILYAPDVARYRAAPSSGNPVQDLSLGAADAQFTLLGRFMPRWADPQLATGVRLCGRLAIGHSESGNAYALANVITPAGVCFSLGVPNAVTRAQAVTVLDGNTVTFPAAGSTTRNIFYVEGPVSYVCDLTNRTLRRFWGYAISANQATHATEAQLNGLGAASSLVARDVTGCTFAYTARTPQHGGLVRMQLTFTRNGETVRVFNEVREEERP